MDRSRRSVERQRGLVESLRRQLHFEWLVLQRLAEAYEEPSPSVRLSMEEVRRRAENRRSRSLLLSTGTPAEVLD